MSHYRAAVCTTLSGPQSIVIEQREKRSLKNGEIRIAIKAIGLNFPDVLMTYGKYQFRPEPPFTPGMEAAGEILEVANGTEKWQVGDRVMIQNRGDLIADQVIVHHKQVSKLPDALNMESGACWSVAASTAWHALCEQGKLQPGESILVLGASGGVGMAAVKLAKHEGARVIATGSTEEKRQAILAAGADIVLDPADPQLAQRVKDHTGGQGANVVYDPVGGDLAITATRAIAWGGRYLIIGFASGTIPAFPANHIMIKAYNIIGIRAGESIRRDPEMAERQSDALQSLAQQGVMQPHISSFYSLDDTQQALETLESRVAIGRVVIKP